MKHTNDSRRYAFFALALFMILCTACGRQNAALEPTDASATVSEAAFPQTLLPDETQTIAQTPPAPGETETEPTATQPPATTSKPPASTTKPPETTKDAPSEKADDPPPVTLAVLEQDQLLEPPESGSEPFQAKFVRIQRSWDQDFELTGTAVDSRETLQDALRSVTGGRHADNADPDYVSGYTDEWFRTHRLIIVATQESSGSDRHNVRKVTYTPRGVSLKIRRLSPDVRTCDVAHWLILIELPDTRLHAGDPVKIDWMGTRT